MDRLIERAVAENVLRSMCLLRHGAKITENRIRVDGPLTIGAVYCPDNGEVVFLD